MTKSTTMVTSNVFRSTRLFREGSSNMVLFSLQHGTMRSNMTDHTTMMKSRNKFRSIQISKMRPKRRLWLKSLSLYSYFNFIFFFFFCVEKCIPIFFLKVELTISTKSGFTT